MRKARQMVAVHQIRHTVRFGVPPAAVYRALMDSRRHTAFTGAPAKVDAKVGGRFSAWGPHLSGITVELVRDRRIVQAWRAENWPAGVYSIATFELKRTASGTTLTFTQAGVPAKNLKSIDEGWKSHYWQPLKKYFEKK
jgi:activator of HSP90 ATPase